MFDIGILTEEDRATFAMILGSTYHEPDLVIAPRGKPYLYRWHVIPHNDEANVFLHVQVASDPLRPLHDHPWANQSVILSGGYIEIIGRRSNPFLEDIRLLRQKGEVIHRNAHESHRLVLPAAFPYAMTLFTTGPKVREWGFWTPEGWRSYKDMTEVCDRVSVMKGYAHE